MRLLRNLVQDFIVFSNLFIAACAAFLTAETFSLLYIKQATWFTAIVFCATLLIYNLHYLQKSKTDKRDFRLNWMRKNLLLVYIFSAASLIALSSLIFSNYTFFFFTAGKLSFLKLLLFASIPLLAIAYSQPLLPGQKKSVRSWGWFKPIYLSLFWTVVTILIPIYFTAPNLLIAKPSAIIALLLNRFFFMLGLCLLFNIRDFEEDKKDGLKTLAVVYGKQLTLKYGKWLLLILNILATGVLLYTLNYNKPFIITAFFIPVVLVWLLFHYFHYSRNTASFVLVYDGLMVVKAILLIFAIHYSY